MIKTENTTPQIRKTMAKTKKALIMISILEIDITYKFCGSVKTDFRSVALPLEQGKIGCSY